jgi:hypothetical protein
MARRRRKLPTSKAQARLFGLIAGGGHPRKARSLSRTQARNILRGKHLKRLPARHRNVRTR